MAYQDIMSKLNDQDLPSQRESPSVEDENGQKNQPIGNESELKDEDQTPTSNPNSGRWGGMISGLGLGILGTIAVMHFYVNPKTQTLEPTNPENPVVEVSTSPASGQTVTVAPVELATVTRQLEVTGTVEAYDLLPILPQASGLQIQKVLADEGDLVEAGEVLAVLDNSILRSQIDQAEAGLARTQANLSKLQTGSRPEQIAAAQAKLDRALAQLAELEAGTRPEEIGVAQAKLNEAEARLADARSGSLQDEIAQAEARLEANKADLQLASERVNRYQKLKDQGAVSEDSLEEYLQNERRLRALVDEAQRRIQQLEQGQRSQVDRLEATVDMERQALRQLQNGARLEEIAAATAEVAEVRSNLNELTNGTRPEEIAVAQAEVREAQAQVRYYEAQLEDTTVRAPATGVIANRVARIGDVTNGTKELFTIIAENQLELHAKVPETQLSQVKIGSPVTITSDADSKLKVQGTVREIAPLIDPESRKATVKIDLPPLGAISGSFLRPGMFLRAAIASSSTQGLKIPAQAVVPQADGSSMVYRLTENETVEATPIQVGEIRGNFGGDLTLAKVEIKSGLNLGDQVVVSGAAYLKDGDSVNVVSPELSRF
ncbi:efflux transporter, RND family, MFP subunit [Lyngbya aestuarii BL J]|uniref:Efflux transporter, RND family, MFP subunit n=1 Tax=Lyngbya aestuarii BL J TaxID=1348334 RepID=U7QFC4_9CYAN|nr:efflux RND transporter periplasmic adaptor subunit [Lyngbya aestuarii]ERT06649.1 efflux transporter, RND family, MFP subunit [Lyngbya aestuarii BL J]